MKDKPVKLSTSIIQRIGAYLGTQPYDKVARLIADIQADLNRHMAKKAKKPEKPKLETVKEKANADI